MDAHIEDTDEDRRYLKVIESPARDPRTEEIPGAIPSQEIHVISDQTPIVAPSPDSNKDEVEYNRLPLDTYPNDDPRPLDKPTNAHSIPNIMPIEGIAREADSIPAEINCLLEDLLEDVRVRVSPYYEGIEEGLRTTKVAESPAADIYSMETPTCDLNTSGGKNLSLIHI